jgi:hypothetical protein
MKTFAWINTETEFVENVIAYDGETEITLPPNVMLIEMPEKGITGTWSMAGIGWKYMHGMFVEPPQPLDSQSTSQQQSTSIIGGAPNVIA